MPVLFPGSIFCHCFLTIELQARTDHRGVIKINLRTSIEISQENVLEHDEWSTKWSALALVVVSWHN